MISNFWTNVLYQCYHHTGNAGWGIAWYVNGTLIPELVLKRGETYTFIVEGGTDANDLANYHPFYITSSTSGGRLSNAQVDQVSQWCKE